MSEEMDRIACALEHNNILFERRNTLLEESVRLHRESLELQRQGHEKMEEMAMAGREASFAAGRMTAMLGGLDESLKETKDAHD